MTASSLRFNMSNPEVLILPLTNTLCLPPVPVLGDGNFILLSDQAPKPGIILVTSFFHITLLIRSGNAGDSPSNIYPGSDHLSLSSLLHLRPGHHHPQPGSLQLPPNWSPYYLPCLLQSVFYTEATSVLSIHKSLCSKSFHGYPFL